MSFIGALGNNNESGGGNNTFNFNDLKIRIVDIDTSNYALYLDTNSSNYTDEISFNSSNYTDVIGLNSSNYTDVIGLNSSNYTDVIGFNSSNYTDVIDNYSSNYTERINQELSDRIGFPAPLFPVEIPTGVYFPLKQQELIIADVGRVVGLHTIAIGTIEEQILALVGTGGIIGIITGGAVGTALTTAANAKSKVEEAISTANTAKSTAETATITAEEGQTIAERAEGKADTSLSIWNRGTVFAGDANNPAYDYTNNIYHLQTGNVGIGVTNDTELTHKLVVNGNSKLNGNVLLNGSLNIENLNANTFLRFYNYSDATTIKQSGFIYLSDYTEVFAMDTEILPIELRIAGNPIIQVYSDKVDITKSLNVTGDITFTGNLYQGNSLFTSGGGGTDGTDGTTYDDENRLNYEFLKEPIEDVVTISNIDEPTIIQDANIQEPQITQTANIQEPTIDLVIQEPTSSPSVPITPIDSDYKYMSFTYTSGATNTSYTITFNDNTLCDILVIGGGGGGGKRGGGGGGAGTCIYHKNQVLNGNYDITVGKGGIGGTTIDIGNGTNGYNSQFIKNNGTKKYLSIGGAGGLGSHSAVNNIGGSGGGTNYSSSSSLLTPNNFFNNSSVSIVSGSSYNNTGLTLPEGCRGNLGGGQVEDYKAGGGGGAGSVGQNHGVESTPNDGYGGDGLGIDITGVNILYAGGGNGSDFQGSQSQSRDPNKSTIESRGGGGFGSDNGTPEGGKNGTGGGGGGQGAGNNNGGTGGSGIVIIRYRYTRPSASQVQTINSDYKYLWFPQTTQEQTLYSMNFLENTEVQLLVASNSFVRYINPFTQTLGKINILVGNAGGHSSYASISTSGQTTPYNAFNSDISGSIVSYNNAIVIVRYKYTRPIIQVQLIDSNYKYIAFLNNTGLNQISYTINLQEPTEIQLLLLDDLKYIEKAPYTTVGQTTINVGNPSTFNTTTTNTNSTFYDFTQSHLSSITGTSTGYNKPIVIVRYKYTRPQTEVHFIDDNYKYVSFPYITGFQTVYGMNFPEETEVQLLLLNSTNYNEITPFTITTGAAEIKVGLNAPTTFKIISTDDTATTYTKHVSTITGSSITYNNSIVIVRYKYEKTVITQVPKYGFLIYNNDNEWDVEPVNTVANILPLLNSNHFEEITNKIALKNFNNSGRFNYQKLSNPGSAGSLVYDNVTGWYTQPEMIYYHLNIIRENNNPNPGFGVVVVETLKTVGLEIKNAEWGKLYITTNPQGKPQYTTDISNGDGSGYMIHHLEVDGSTKINGTLTSTAVSAGSLGTNNLNMSGNQHIFFAGACCQNNLRR